MPTGIPQDSTSRGFPPCQWLMCSQFLRWKKGSHRIQFPEASPHASGLCAHYFKDGRRGPQQAPHSSKKLPARMWPKTAVSAHSHTSDLKAGLAAAKLPNSSSKRLPAKIWPKTAVSAHSHTSGLIADPEQARRGQLSLDPGKAHVPALAGAVGESRSGKCVGTGGAPVAPVTARGFQHHRRWSGRFSTRFSFISSQIHGRSVSW